ncbi:MAG: 3-hydroxyacyl-ACP dehydratase FabZ [Thermoanaerobaculaceae bacterium]|nr:3-hydroxyacyl-ACP dehydratase FabZ [Thermoanaerobaculaceae bacterium]MDI9621763.1 3-hydroxyacyl-ACP dehydratase FabZ [Acidobacteriota bacterium]NLH10989.1 3-hydroxyacyl-ACP dehydratase FabZ [Holophagae bacterium]HPW55998.1 3-hydroxyacyl-ACP dehydratase FabZ [Thermoanaerobaculaceae bacterium]
MIDILGILDVLPHRYPFLLVDRILEMDDQRVLGLKNVTFNEPHFTGHFPGAPVMPGVLIVEAMAQAGAVMMLSGVPDRHGKLIYFTGIDKCRFRRPVVPGDQLLLEVRLVRRRARYAVMHGIARVGEEIAAEAELSSAMVDRPQGGE